MGSYVEEGSTGGGGERVEGLGFGMQGEGWGRRGRGGGVSA